MEYFMERLRWSNAWSLIVLGAAMAVGTAWLVQGGNVRLAVVGALLSVLGSLALISPRAAIVATFIFLTVLGDFRRALIPLTGWSSQDPLLLVGAAIAALLVVFAVVARRLSLDTPLSRWVLVLMLVMLLQMVNPVQGGLNVGMAGALFYLVPLLWFWVGRTYATPVFMAFLLYRVVIPLAVLAALLGLYQTFFGLLPFEKDWVDLSGYESLDIEGHIRPFSFFASSTEYAHFVGVALVVLCAGWLRGGVRAGLILIPLLALATFLVGSRGIIVTVLFAVVLLWALQGRSPAIVLPRLILGLALGAGGLAWILTEVPQFGLTGPVEALTTRQAMGLLNPQESTLPLHIDLFLGGFAEGVVNPLGRGLGATTLAAGRFGDTGGTDVSLGGTEVDISNMFVSLGIVGGVVYVVIVALVLLSALRYWRRSRTLVALAILGVVVVELGQWTIGGHYVVSALVWFCIGGLDRFQRLRRDTVEDCFGDAQDSTGGGPGTRELRDSAGGPSSRAPSGLGSKRSRF